MIQPRNKTQERLLNTCRFLAGLLIFGLLFQAANRWMPATIGFQTLYAELVSLLLSPFGEVAAAGIGVEFEGFRYVISQDCLGWKSWAVLSGLIAASFDRELDWRLKGIFAGLGLIFVLNTARVVSTVVLADLGVGFDLLHSVTWRWGMTASVLVIWALWRNPPTFLNKQDPLINNE